MSLAVDNIDVLRHGWEDAVSTVTPDLDDVRAAMEDEFARAVADDRLDEHSLLAVVRDIVSVASRAGGADSARLLSKALHRSVYEYLLSLDAMTPEETEVVDRPLGGAADRSLLIGFEEVAELEQRQSALAAAAVDGDGADAALLDEADVPEALEAPELLDEAEVLEAPDMPEESEAPPAPEAEDVPGAFELPEAFEDGAAHDKAHFRPRFRLFRRGERQDGDTGIEPPGVEPAGEAPPPPPPPAAAYPPPAAAPEWWRGPTALPAPEAPEPEATVAPLAEAMAEISGANVDFEEFDEPAEPVSWAAPEPVLGSPPAAPPPGPEQPGAPEPPEADAPAAAALPGDDAPAPWRVREPQPQSSWPQPDIEAPAASEPPEAEAPAPDGPNPDTGLGALEAWAAGAHPTDPTGSFGAPFVVERPAGNGAPHEESSFTVAPREGFHLTEDNDFFTEPDEVRAPEMHGEPSAPAGTPAGEPASLTQEPSHDGSAADHGEEHKGWHIRRSPRHAADVPPEMSADALADLLDTADDDQAHLLERDPYVAEARNEINDRLRRRRCDEAASLLQRLATDVGGRGVAELALDAGDRCRALGKANAALSCYIAASRADPVFEGPLLRLADVCLDDRDVDLAVSYLDRVARLHRMRGDTRGALRIYRKIATIAPYRDDILATLMRANSTGQFED